MCENTNDDNIVPMTTTTATTTTTTTTTTDQHPEMRDEAEMTAEEAEHELEKNEGVASLSLLQLSSSPKDMTIMSSAEIALELEKVTAMIASAKASMRNLSDIFNQQEAGYREDEIQKLNQKRMELLKESLGEQLRSAMNGAMAARNTLDKCLENLKVNGKPGRQWISIRKLLAPVTPQQRCMAFKPYKFPTYLPTTVTSKIKAVIVRCLCTKHPTTGHASIGMALPKVHMKDEEEEESAIDTMKKVSESRTTTGSTSSTSTSTNFLENELTAKQSQQQQSQQQSTTSKPTTSATTASGGDEQLDPKQLAAKLEQIQKDKEEVKSSMSTIATKLEKEEKTFNKERVFKKEKIKLAVMKRKSNDKALKMFEEISKMTKKRRLALVRDCLKQIMGSGQNVLYWELRKMFASTPMEAQCSVLKAFKFPTLKWHGYNDKIVKKTRDNDPLNGGDPRPIAYRSLNVNPPPNDGSMVTEYGDGVKISLFRCMCEERTMMASGEGEGEGEAAELEEKKDGESPNEEEPTLKNKKEEKEVEIIEKEEKQVDEEEAELKADPMLQDLITP